MMRIATVRATSDLAAFMFHSTSRNRRARGGMKARRKAMKGIGKKRKKKNTSGLLVVTRKNGKRVGSNATVSMPLKSLRRLISSARTGKRTSTKVRVRP